MKITVRISPNSAADLDTLVSEARKELANLAPDAEWTIDDVDIWGSQDAQSKDGLLILWNGTVTASAEVADN